MSDILSLFKDFLRRIVGRRVSFNDGSYVEYLNREGIEYVEGEHRVEITWYFDKGFTMRRRILSLDENFGHWDAPSEDEEIPEEKVNEILEKVRSYCKHNRIPLRVVDSMNKRGRP